MTFYFQRFREFVLALSGAHIETLKLVPTERTRFESLGWAILITSGLAVVSMWFALASAMNINGIVAIPIALCWGLVIMGIDRWLVTSMPVDSNRKFVLAVPRIVLALLLGTLISTPLVLRIFQTEINAQIATMQQNNYNAFLTQQQSSQVGKQVTTYANELQNLNTTINSQGASTGNNSADPELVSYNNQLTSLQKQLTTWTQAKTQDLKEYSCQRYGGADCPKAGVGPAAQASLASYNQASAQVTKVEGEINQVQQEITARTKELNSTSKVDEQNRYQEALTERPVVQQEYNTAVQRQNQLQQVFYAQNQASHGILEKLEALSELSSGNLTVTVARILLFLLFLVIECLPVTVKLLQRPGHYEAALARAKAAEVRDVEEYYSEWGGSRGNNSAFVPAAAGSAPANTAPPAFESRQDRRQRQQAEEERAAANVFAVWSQTKAMPRVVGDPEDERSTHLVGNPAPAAQGPHDFPPSESDPRVASGTWSELGNGQRGSDDGNDGWGRPAAPAQQSPSSWHEQATADIGEMWTRPEPRAAETRTVYDSEYAPRQGQGSYEEGTSLRDALSDMDDDAPYSPRTDGGTGGMPLNWDDE